MRQHENKIGLPWAYVRLSKGSFGNQLDILDYIEFDMHSLPKKDATGHWIFSLKHEGRDVCMVRCWGKAALVHAVGKVAAGLTKDTAHD